MKIVNNIKSKECLFKQLKPKDVFYSGETLYVKINEVTVSKIDSFGPLDTVYNCFNLHNSWLAYMLDEYKVQKVQAVINVS